MQTPPTLTFRGVRYPALLEKDVKTRLARLERYYPAIVSARVRIDLFGRRKDGNRFRVLVELGVPGADVIVAHNASIRPALLASGRRIRKQDESDSSHRHARVAIREAFETARRRLQEHVRKRRRP